MWFKYNKREDSESYYTKEVGWTSQLYNIVREDGQNVYITQMKPILSITKYEVIESDLILCVHYQ